VVHPRARLCATEGRCSTLNFSTPLLWFTLHIPTCACKGKQQLVQELPKKRRRTEVSVPYSGSGSAIGWHNNTLKIDLCSCTRMRSASAFCTSARCLRRAALSSKGESHRLSSRCFLAPICVDQFHQVANASANLSELDKSATLGIGARLSRRAAGQ
jgi:hypothetical protein